MLEQVVDDVRELCWVSGREEPVLDLVNHLLQLGVGLVVHHGVVALLLQGLDLEKRKSTSSVGKKKLFKPHLFHGHAEDEDVVQAHLLRHLHVGSVHGADGQSAVQLKIATLIILRFIQNFMTEEVTRNIPYEIILKYF